MNRLKDSTSPYLLQHADNPVDWWPWCEQAFAEAAERDVPVLLSVGYSACHWCHVMAHESFEDPQTAALLNEHMVAIKVDREERPDVDAVYMTATQAMTGQGGWPMTVFMTPGKEPFFCATYLPRDYFRQLVVDFSRAWRGHRGDVSDRAGQITAALAGNAAAIASALRGQSGAESSAARFREVADAAVAALERDYDTVLGGFGGAPKFPPSMVLEFLLRAHERTGARSAPGGTAPRNLPPTGGSTPPFPVREPAIQMAEGTCEAMARGGMYDQLGGGFARYSVDVGWVVPHFEKMLYDNALLARVYAHLWRRSGSGLARRVAEETCDWMLRELRTAGGGLAASLDADSEGEEGKFYVWRPAELRAILAPEDAEFAARAFNVTEAGTFERGASVLQLRADPEDAGRLARVRAALLAARGDRVRPGRDDKVVAAWNGLAVSALAECGLLFGRPDLVAAARDVAALLATVHLTDGHRLVRTSRDGTAGNTAGALEDYACTAEGFLTLSGVTGEARWLELAGGLLEVALGSFGDGHGGFFDTAADDERLIFRPADPADNATPSGAFAVAGALLSYAALTGSARHRDAAEAALGVLPGIAARYPRAAGAGLAVAEAWLAGPVEIAVVGPPADERTRVLHQTALHAAPPGAVLALGDGAPSPASGPADPGPAGSGQPGSGPADSGPAGSGQPGSGPADSGPADSGPARSGSAGPAPAGGVPLLAGRGLADGAPAAYVCRQFACLAPVTTPEQLREALARPA